MKRRKSRGRLESSNSRRGSTTSLRSQRSSTVRVSRQRPAKQPQEEELAQLLVVDFMAMMDATPKPEQAFPKGSSDYRLAWAWLNKLSTYTCNTLADRRLRNLYMSHLSVHLNEKSMKGIFMQMPPTHLELVDFNLPPGMACGMYSTGADSNMCAPLEQTQCQSRYGGGKEQAKSAACSVCAYNMALDNAERGEGYVADIDDEPGDDDGKESQRSAVSSSPKSMESAFSTVRCSTAATPLKTPGSAEVLQHDISYLLESIKLELRGQQPKERNEYLESELCRYRAFQLLHKNSDDEFDDRASAMKKDDRTFLLLNMQNDLVKLLSDEYKRRDK